jgi:hypothetical protein
LKFTVVLNQTLRKEDKMLGHNKDANPGYKEKLNSMRSGGDVMSSFTNGLRQHSFKDTVNGKLGLHADKSYAEPHSGTPARLKTGGLADGGDTSMLNRGQKDCHGGKVFSRGGSLNERAPGRPQASNQFEKSPRHGDSNQSQFTKKSHSADSGQRQFEKKPARAKSGGQMSTTNDDAEHHSWGDFVSGLKNFGQNMVHLGTLGAVDIGGHGALHDIGDFAGKARRTIAHKAVPILSGGTLQGDELDGKLGGKTDTFFNKGGKVQKKAIGGVAKIRHGQMSKKDMA